MKQEKTTQQGKAWLKQELRPYRSSILFLAVISVLATLFSTAFAYLVKYLVNSATDKNLQNLLIFAGVLLGLMLCKIALQTYKNFLSEKTRANMVNCLRQKTFSKILQSNYAQLQSKHSGELLNLLTSDITEIAVDSVGLLQSALSMAVQCIGAVVALATIDWLFTLILFVCGSIFYLISAFFKKKIKQYHKDFMAADGDYRSFMQEGLTSSLTIKAYNALSQMDNKTAKLGQEYYQKRMKRNWLNTLMHCVFTLLSNVGTIFAIVWCSVSILQGNPDYGSLLSVVLLLTQLQHPLTSFSSILPVYYARLASAERLAEIYQIPTEEQQKLDCSQIYQGLQKISFQNICFSYDRDVVLNNVSASVQKGEIICIIGASGSGKSTLFKLLLSVFTPQSGQVCAVMENGEILPILPSHRGLFAYVPQGNFLFSGTIYENLTFFSEETNEAVLQEKIKNALQTACAEFVWALPQGLQTQLFERGDGLSEGQLQRLAIARALLSERPILLLDEATSALDEQTEKRLLENIKGLQNKTCLIVTHRPAALSIADNILKIQSRTM